MSESLFPVLTSPLIEKIKKYGEVENVSTGSVLLEAGSKNFCCFVVLTGEITITDPFREDTVITRHGPGEFSGDSDMLSQRAAMVEGTMTQAGEVIRIQPTALREMIANMPEASDILLQAFLLRRDALINDKSHGARLIGSRYSPDTFRIRQFLSRNDLPYTWLDIEKDAEAQQILKDFDVQAEDTPLLIANRGSLYKNPQIETMAACFGISDYDVDVAYDVVVVGAGPGGLAASVYAASEGLKVLTVDSVGPGGQAGTSSKIENYLGFPTGISGQELANRAYMQVQKFGGTIVSPRTVEHLDCSSSRFILTLSKGEKISARSVVIATGAQYIKLPISNLRDYEGRGVYYGATNMEAQTCLNEEVIVVGGGNSAGQATVFLANHARKVHLFIRSGDLEHSMSQYLIQRITQTPNVELHTHTEITALHGEGHLERVSVKQKGESFEIETQHVFTMIGASPATDWARDCVLLDKKGFVLTGTHLNRQQLSEAGWAENQSPSLLETSKPGIYAVGDVRSDSTKRVASAVGEGSMCISFVHRYLNGG
jgi:thioredoxin reductase (NADPH)